MTDKPKAPTAEEFQSWLLPSQAVARLPWKEALARETLLQHLQHEQVLAAPAAASWFDDKGRRVEVNLSIIGTVWWRSVGDGFYSNPFWTTGSINFSRNIGRLNDERMTCFGVRFDPAGITAIILRQAGAVFSSNATSASGSAPESGPETPPARHPGGRPRADYWDDLWVEMCRRIYHEGFAPARQADIEKAMLEWAESNDHKMSEGSARDRARKLWRAVFTEDKN